MTPSFFLSPRPGELLYSALARHSEAVGAAGPKAIMGSLFGKPDLIATIDLPNNLGRLAARLPPAAQLDVERLAWEHTLLPYYTRFQPPAVRDRALAAMMGSGGSVHLMLGIPTFRTGRPGNLQFCPDCLADMKRRFGSLHWRSVHQLPGVLVCPDHRKRLRQSMVTLNATNRHEFVPADDANCSASCPPITGPLAGEIMDHAFALACASAALLQHDHASRERTELRAEYRRSMQAAGLLRGRFNANQGELASRFQRHWGGLLNRLGGVDLEGRTESWLASLVRTSSGAQPPLQHLLVRLFLGAQPTVPSKPMQAYVPRHRRPKADRVKPVANPRLDWRNIDLSYSEQLRQAALIIRQAEPPQRVTLGAIERLLGRRDWLSKRKAKLPQSCAAADAVTEEVTAFQTRRLRWHAIRCRAEDILDPWVLLRRAGLPGLMIEAARAELPPG